MTFLRFYRTIIGKNRKRREETDDEENTLAGCCTESRSFDPTVLRVLNGEEHVNPSTRRHVSAVLSRYGYLLRRGKRREKLVIYGREGNPMLELLLKGILQDTRRKFVVRSV